MKTAKDYLQEANEVVKKNRCQGSNRKTQVKIFNFY